MIQKYCNGIFLTDINANKLLIRKQPSRGVPMERYSENMQQNYRRIPMPKCEFNKVALQLY